VGEIRNYRDLIVWQKSMLFVTEVYKLTENFPSKEMYGIASQLRRAIISVPTNIAEGYGRNSIAEYKRFSQIALGSLYEVQTLIEVSFNLGYASREVFMNMFELSRELERMMTALIKKLSAS
jgi:four helix bundle protein